MPDESIELFSEDGLYSGFYVKDEEQYIVVFPLIDSIVPDVLIKEELPFMKQPEPKTEIFNAIIDADTTSTKASNIIAKLKKYDFLLAIPSTPASKILKADIKECHGFEINVFFTPFVNDAGAEDPKQYAAQLAKSAMDLRSTDLGATISNIFREKKGDKVKVTLRFRGREMAHMASSKHILDDFAEQLADCSVIEKPAKVEGRSMTMVLAEKR